MGSWNGPRSKIIQGSGWLAMKILLLSAFLSLPCLAGHWHKAWKVSAAVLGSVSVADGYSSAGLVELNPILGRGQFGVRQVSIKTMIVGGVLVGEWWLGRKHPEYEKAFVFANFGVAGVTGFVVAKNMEAR